MPIIDFPYYLDGTQLRASIYARGTITAKETVDGFGAGDLGATVYGTSNIFPNIGIDGEVFIGASIYVSSSVIANESVSVPLGPALISGTSAMWGSLQYSYGTGMLPTLVGLASDREIAQGIGYIQPLFGAADGDFYVPPLGNRHFGAIAGLTSTGLLKDPELGIGILPALVAQAWDSSFNEASGGGVGYFGPLISASSEGLRLEPIMHSLVFVPSAFFYELDIVLVFNSNMTAADIFTADHVKVQNYLETLTVEDALTFLGSYQLDKMQALGITSTFLASVTATSGSETVPGTFTEGTTTWVFNVDSGGTTQYDGYGFNSFAKRSADYLGAAADGIYTLAGDDDEGVDIDASIDLAISRFSTPQTKYFPAVYLGVTSTGKLLLKANVDGTDWIFEANNASATISNQRIDLSRGLRGSHWHFTILNQDGLDFDLESVEFLPLVSSRRVY